MKKYLVDAFIDQDGGGNLAGVVLDADALAPAEKLAIAREIGASETAFVAPARGHTARVEFFTPTRQIAHCGHATVAAFTLLRSLGHIADGLHSKLSIEGPRAVRIEDGHVWLAQRAPSITSAAEIESVIKASIGLRATQSFVAEPVFVDVGNRFLHLELASAEALRNITPDHEKVRALSERFDLVGFYLAARNASTSERHATTRMFAPRYGIAEESATGMAAGGLGALLAVRSALTRGEYLIEQGRLMPQPSPSLLRVRIEGDAAIESIWTGGRGRVRPAA
jgi:PhzF family phenazine biosynthesis protein